MDETLYAIQAAIDRVGANAWSSIRFPDSRRPLRRPTRKIFRSRCTDCLGRSPGVGITILLTVEVTEPYGDMRFTPHPVSFLTHDIILQRYFELGGELHSFLTIIKTRARNHSRDMREYKVTSRGLVIGKRLSELAGLITAVPRNRESPDQ